MTPRRSRRSRRSSARRSRARSARSRSARSRSARRSRKARVSSGGGVLGGVVSALKTALPSIVLYEALKMQGKRVGSKGKRRGRKSHRRKR